MKTYKKLTIERIINPERKVTPELQRELDKLSALIPTADEKALVRAAKVAVSVLIHAKAK